MKGALRHACLLLIAASLSACSLFGGKDDEESQPLELTKIKTSLDVKRSWARNIGQEAEFLRVALRPAGDGNRLYAASFDGNVVAIQPDSGREIWETRLDEEISAGPGVGEDRLAVVTKDGELVVLDANSGQENWRKFIGGESLATPLIRGGTVVVQTVDNRLRAYGLLDGNERWTLEESTPALTVRGNASPMAVGNIIVAGFDNGRVMAVDLSSGDVEWQQMLSPPSGRSDLDRLSDVDGQIAVVGQDVYAAGYQGRIFALAAESGQALWAREFSTVAGVQADFANVYTVLDGGEILAMSRRTGAELWRQESLLRREGTVPVSFQSTVVVGDLEGYLHFFSKETGEPVARLRPGKQAISNPPIVVANTLYVQNDSGAVFAYTIKESRPTRSAPDIANDD